MSLTDVIVGFPAAVAAVVILGVVAGPKLLVLVSDFVLLMLKRVRSHLAFLMGCGNRNDAVLGH